MSAPLPERVRVVEVGPRDGLQNEPRALGTRVKLDFVEALAESGLTDIEVSSFVRPDRVPQLADADEVFAALDEKPGVRYWALVPNETGLRRALEVGVRHIAVLASATEGFSRANVNAGAGEALTSLEPVVALARHAGAEVRGYVSTVFGCPYDGEVPPRQAARATKALFDMGCSEVSLGDTIGVAVPTDIPRVLEAHDAAGVERSRLALHLHDTRGTALANVWAGLTEGIRR